MPKSTALGTTLEVESDTPGTFIAVGNLTSIPVPGPEKPEVDVTDFDSTGVETLPGLPDYGDLSFSGNYNDDNAGQNLLFTDGQDLTPPTRNWRIDMPGQDVRFTFAGWVRSFRPTASGVNEAVRFEATLRVTGAVTRTSPIPA